MSKLIVVAAATAFTFAQGAPALAQLPPGVFAGERDYKLAPAGAYALDPAHTAVIAKVSHIGYSLSVFRFGKIDGSLTWDPGKPSRSSLSASVETASISTPVPDFAAQLAGDGFLKSAAFPKASFVSTAFHQTDASHGRVEGRFTLMGKTRPLTFDVELVGAGKGFMGHPRIGMEAKAQIDPRDYGMPPVFSDPIRLEIDAEFAQTS
ncbi:MAG TPA: YceI family protein [Lichenihabitans sp.]|jgi:polyisoprenoid-binding protein YceI|nr:YceI family protein [Lichenihabitans sp.]